MNARIVAQALSATVLLAAPLLATAQMEFDPKKALSEPKTYVGSDVCKTCHLEHYDAWQKTLHSRMLQDAVKNRDVVVTDIDPEIIRADLAKIEKKLKVPSAEIYIPKLDEILYTIGSQWKQRYLIKREGKYVISPIQYNIDTGRWVNYHEHDWEKRPWLAKCGGCHATGVDLEKESFKEPGVACESCHGPGSHHAALPRSAVFEKRETIVNPAKLTPGIAVQICGSCHNRGKAKNAKAGWPVGYLPGKALETYYESTSLGGGDVKHFYANEFSKGHHQQYIDWMQSRHKTSGVNCMTCHKVHDLNATLVARGQTQEKGDQLCTSCHQPINKNGAHAVHSFGNCIGCHMPKIAKSAESGDIRSHVFVALEPQDTLDNPKLPNSCQTCHRHKDEDLEDLQKRYERLKALPKAQGQVVQAAE
jgi:formate-dependent nitrite reductase cytochrome c552 subunit